MQRRPSRRAFFKQIGAAAIAAPTVPLLGCTFERPEPDEAVEVPDGPSITRPILVPWSEDAVRILAPASLLPMAYVSVGLQRVFVDSAFRDRVIGLLNVHVSVSTGLWRIPLPGDGPEEPLVPGDTAREFEVAMAREWDPTRDPAEGDFRIMPGRCVNVRVDFSCAPISGLDEWFSAGPWDIGRCDPARDGMCREDFHDIGTGSRYEDRDCTRRTGAVRYLTWACLEE